MYNITGTNDAVRIFPSGVYNLYFKPFDEEDSKIYVVNLTFVIKN
jgi:hypothetical protein